MCLPVNPSNVRQSPGPLVGKLYSFETNNVIPVACGNFGEVNKTASRMLCVLAKKAASCSHNSELVPSTATLRVPISVTISSSPNGAGPCLQFLPVGLRPSSSAAFPSSGRQWLPLLRPPKRRAILLHCVSGTSRRGIVSTLATLLITNTAKRFDTDCGLLRLLAFSVSVVDDTNTVPMVFDLIKTQLKNDSTKTSHPPPLLLLALL
jgi:hypothetical protein